MIDIFKHLLPRSKAWVLTPTKQLREFFEGLAGLPGDVRAFFDGVYSDRDPRLTRNLSEYEHQFGLPGTGLNEQERRDRLAAAWAAVGGQSPRYIQDTLQAAGFDVYVHEWWESIPGRPLGGSIAGDVSPVARDPALYMDDGTSPIPWAMLDGGTEAQDGDEVAADGQTLTPAGYPLVNKASVTTDSLVSDGAGFMADGAPEAQDGFTYSIYTRRIYPLPTDPATFPYFLYIGGETFPQNATVPGARREEFEDLCLKICPTHLWLGVLVSYN